MRLRSASRRDAWNLARDCQKSHPSSLLPRKITFMNEETPCLIVADRLAVSQSACGAAFHQRALLWRSVSFVLADKGQKTPAAPPPPTRSAATESDAEPTQMQNRTDERTDVCSREIKKKNKCEKRELVNCGVFVGGWRTTTGTEERSLSCYKHAGFLFFKGTVITKRGTKAEMHTWVTLSYVWY